MEKEFEVTRMKNGRGESNLLVITEDAVMDQHIGTVIIVPYANGFRDPVKAVLQCNEVGIPIRCNEKFAIVSQFIYE